MDGTLQSKCVMVVHGCVKVMFVYSPFILIILDSLYVWLVLIGYLFLRRVVMLCYSRLSMFYIRTQNLRFVYYLTPSYTHSKFDIWVRPESLVIFY